MDLPLGPPAGPTLIGQRLASLSGVPWGALSLLLTGLILAALWAIRGAPEWGLFALLTSLMGLAIWLTQPRKFAAELSADGLTLLRAQQSIPYRSLDGLKAPRRPRELDKPASRPFAIQVFHRNGVVTIPPRLNVPSDRVFHFLLQQLVMNGGERSPPPLLAGYLDRQQARHGVPRVLVFRARQYLAKEPGSGRRCAISLAVGLTGLLWFFLGWHYPAVRYEVWGVLGLALLMCALVVAGLFALYIPSKKMPGRWASACLIVSPDGLALAQGKVQGELRWEEVRKVEVSSKQLGSQDRSETFRGGIRVKVDGAEIVIGDIYDRPLALIQQAIRSHWRENS